MATKAGVLNGTALTAGRVAGVVDERDAAAGHSLAAPYVRWQLSRNLADLGRERLDALFLHNPERTTQPARLHAQLRDSFAVLEEAAAAGSVTVYGIATWNMFTGGAVTVADLDRLATEAAGTRDHHLRMLQLPVSLVTADALTEALDGRGPIAEAAGRGWSVHASAPLHGGELPDLATPELAALLRPGLDVTAACLLAAAVLPRRLETAPVGLDGGTLGGRPRRPGRGPDTALDPAERPGSTRRPRTRLISGGSRPRTTGPPPPSAPPRTVSCCGAATAAPSPAPPSTPSTGRAGCDC